MRQREPRRDRRQLESEMIKLIQVVDKLAKEVGENEKEIFLGRRILKAKSRRRLLPTKEFLLVRNVGKHIKVNADRGQMFATSVVKKGIMQRIAIRSEIQKAEQILPVIRVNNNSTQFRLR